MLFTKNCCGLIFAVHLNKPRGGMCCREKFLAWFGAEQPQLGSQSAGGAAEGELLSSVGVNEQVQSPDSMRAQNLAPKVAFRH